MTPDAILERLACFYNVEHRSFANENAKPMKELMDRFVIYDKSERSYEHPEQRVHVYTTSKGEELSCCCNGQSFIDEVGRSVPYTQTCLTDQNGNEIKYINITDIWNMFYELSEKDMALIACVALVFYHLQLEKEYRSLKQIYINDGSGRPDILWSLPRFDDDIIISLNELIGGISVGRRSISISFEAFIYYCELEFSRKAVLPQETRNVYRNKRQEIFKIIIWIAGYYMGFISYGDLLAYIKDCLPGTMGVTGELISGVTKGAVHIAITDLKQALKEEGIEFLERSSMKVGRGYISYLICIPRAKIIVTRDRLPDHKMRMLTNTEWRTVSINEIDDFASFNKTLRFIRSSIR